MAENILETRIQLRYDTYVNWMRSSVILKAGEVAVAKVNYSSSINPSTSQYSENAAIGIKVGDGESYFYELPWLQAVSADVYNWAKSSVKPTYTAQEIEGLQAFVEEYSGGGGSGGSTTVATRIYQIVQGTGNNSNKYYLQYKTSDSDTWITDTAHYIDVDSFVKLVNWIGDDVDEYFTLSSKIAGTVNDKFELLNVEDDDEDNKVVVAVNQINGKINTIKKVLNLNNLIGPLSPTLGGTGITEIGANEILVGSSSNTFTKRTIEPEVDDSNNLATNHAIIQYINERTAGLTGAMHYVGEATVEISTSGISQVNPQIRGYDFSKVQFGDVITRGSQEFVWTGAWQLLGDESSYAIKGSIMNADISPNAQIDQSKIYNLTEDLANKVTQVEGKGLSTFDFNTEFRNKLLNIEDGAQVNIIEHIFVNDIERPVTTINGLEKSIALSIDVFDAEHAEKLDGIEAGAQVNAIEHIFLNGIEIVPSIYANLRKSVNIVILPYTESEKQKLAGIENNAQVNIIEHIKVNNIELTPDANKTVSITIDPHLEHINKIESISINGTVYPPNEQKQVNITLDQAALNLNVLEGATIPDGQGSTTNVSQVQKKLQLERIAVTGDVQDLLQTADTYITLDCGSSTTVI